jgi:hypothetical protein
MRSPRRPSFGRSGIRKAPQPCCASLGDVEKAAAKPAVANTQFT